MFRFGAGYRSTLNGNDLDITGNGKKLNRVGFCRESEAVKQPANLRGKAFVRELRETSSQDERIYRSSSCPHLRSRQPCVTGAWQGDRLGGLCKVARDN